MATKIILKDKTELIIDSTSSRGKSISVKTTEHPIEDTTRASITDHIIVNPNTYKVSGKLSDIILPTDRRKNKYTDIDSLLEAITLSGDLVTLETKNDSIKNLKITAYSVDESTGTGNTYNISIDLQEIFFASSQTVTIKKTAKATNKQALGRKKSNQATNSTVAKKEVKNTQDKFSTKTAKGKKTTQPAKTKQKSALVRGLDWFSNLAGSVLPIQ
jgi:hypothetical protein